MSRPKVRGHRRGGRDRQFFEGLSGFARGLDKAIDDCSAKPPTDPVLAAQEARRIANEKLAEAEAKRQRRMNRNLRDK